VCTHLEGRRRIERKGKRDEEETQINRKWKK
jgi:hypothetical protein